MEIKKVKFGMWEIKFGFPKKIDVAVIKKLEEFINQQWLPVFLQTVEKPWWSIKNLGLPSPIIRIDMAPVEPGDKDIIVEQKIFEVEVRPAGLGIILYLVPEARKLIIKETFRQFCCRGFIQIHSTIQDDYVAATYVEVPYSTKLPSDGDTGPYWIRCNEREGEVLEYEPIALGPISEDGNKEYLVNLGLAQMVKDVKEINWEEPFVVKPLLGSRMEGVEIFIPSSLQKIKESGVSTRARIIKVITERKKEGREYIIQKFISPKKEPEDWRTIWRIFFGWYEKAYKWVGGFWNSRKNLRIHGASDSIFGPLEPPLEPEL